MSATPEEEVEELARDLYAMNPARSPMYPTNSYEFGNPMAGRETDAARYTARFLHRKGWRKT